MAVTPTSGSRTGTVTVPRALLVALSVTLVGALLTVAFLLGRQSGRAENAAPEPEVVAVAQPAPGEPAPVPRPAARPSPRRDPPPRIASEPAPPAPAASPPPSTPAPQPVAPAAPTVDPRERETVARYFDEVDEIAGGSAGVGDPETLAMAMLSQATGGDWSQFDELASTQRTMLRRLRGMRVPTPCREYHQKMTGMLEAGADLLDEVKQGVQSGNLGALGTLSTTAQRLQRDAEAARQLAAAIQQRYQL